MTETVKCDGETTTIKFYGASDDLIEVEGDLPGCDEYPGEREVFVVAGLRIAVEYTVRGTWGLGVELVDESVPVTAQQIDMGVMESGYSMYMTLTVPAGTPVVREAPRA